MDLNNLNSSVGKEMVYSFVVCKVMFFVQLAKQLQRNKIILSSFTLGGGGRF